MIHKIMIGFHRAMFGVALIIVLFEGMLNEGRKDLLMQAHISNLLNASIYELVNMDVRNI